MKYSAVLPRTLIIPLQSVFMLYMLPSRYLVAASVIRSTLTVSQCLCLSNQCSICYQIGCAKKSCKVLPLNEKVNIFSLIGKEKKKTYVDLDRMYSKNESSNHEIVKKEK